MNTIFFCVGCPCSLIFSMLADSNSRQQIFYIISLLCHLSSLILSCFKSYTVLCIWRGISGALVTSSLPIYLSILGDIFPSNLRSVASVLSSIVVGLGQLMGQTLSGFVGSRLGWRAFFQITAILGLLSIWALQCMYSILSSHLFIGRCSVSTARRGRWNYAHRLPSNQHFPRAFT